MSTLENQKMRAVTISNYGGQDQLKLVEIDVPAISPTDVLVKVHAASVNPVDWKIREGYLAEMLPHTLPLTLGWDFSGEVVAVGETVTDWAVGDLVYSRPEIVRNGSYADYIAVAANEIATKPQSLNHQFAAAVPLVTLTAWQALYDLAQVKEGDKVLIHAGAGGVGIAAIQLAKLKGAYVYTTASERNVELLKDLGADEVINYKTEDFSTLKDIDVVFDTMGGDVLDNSWGTLKKGGYLVSIVQPPEEEKAKALGVNAEFCFVQPNAAQLGEIGALIDDGKIKVLIDSVYRLDEVAQAHQKSEAGHAQGKIVIQVAD